MEEHNRLPAETTASVSTQKPPAPEPDKARTDALYASALRARNARLAAGDAQTDPAAPGDTAFQRPAKPDKPRRENDDGERRPRRRGRDRFARRLVLIAIVLALLTVLALLVLPRIDMAMEALTPNVSVTVPDSLQSMLPDETMGYTAIDFTNAILGESRERKELVVMEQDVDVTSRVSQDLLRISLFSKVKIIRSYGTGVYTVALDQIKSESITVDAETCIITVMIPHTTLSYVNVDVDKTEFEDTQKALLAIGDIKLTAEQKLALDQSINEALRARLTEKALFTKADEIALNKVREILQPIVDSISDEYVVKVVMEQA